MRWSAGLVTAKTEFCGRPTSDPQAWWTYCEMALSGSSALAAASAAAARTATATAPRKPPVLAGPTVDELRSTHLVPT